MELSPKNPLNSGRGFCGTELKHVKCFLGLSHHFAVTPTFMLLVVTIGLLWHAVKNC
jgi:hypothetical protein